MGCQNTDEIRQELKTGRAISSLEASARPLLLSNLVEPIVQPQTLFLSQTVRKPESTPRTRTLQAKADELYKSCLEPQKPYEMNE